MPRYFPIYDEEIGCPNLFKVYMIPGNREKIAGRQRIGYFSIINYYGFIDLNQTVFKRCPRTEDCFSPPQRTMVFILTTISDG